MTGRPYAHAIVALIVIVSAAMITLAMRHTSPTFDETTTMAGAARGYHTGTWDMLHDYPPVTQYLYGLPAYLAGVEFPAEADTTPHRYRYSQALLWKLGNDAEQIAFRARLFAVAFAIALVVLTYVVASRSFGPVAGVIAAALVAFLPDVLAHGGIAYNDLPVTVLFLASLVAVDGALRKPELWRGALAGVLVSLAIGIKHSALALGPAAVILLLLELAAREDRRAWLTRALAVTGVALLTGYLVQVALYRGDFTLAYLRASTLAAQGHIAGGHGVPAYLLGVMRQQAWWYFYPVSFLFKTPVALQVLILLSLIGMLRAGRGVEWRALLASPTRPYIIGLVVFGALLVRANLTIGFRYALPLLPLICILAAAGLAVLWRDASRLVRGAVVALVLWSAASAVSFYPHFIAYTSEHQPDRDRGYEVFVDSSLDWGQGLLELRDFLREENIGQIYLSYFGSALPEGYGIDYIPMPSFFPLTYREIPEVEPGWVVVSATTLVGMYVNGDPFAALRDAEPYRVLAHTLFVYRTGP